MRLSRWCKERASRSHTERQTASPAATRDHERDTCAHILPREVPIRGRDTCKAHKRSSGDISSTKVAEAQDSLEQRLVVEHLLTRSATPLRCARRGARAGSWHDVVVAVRCNQHARQASSEPLVAGQQAPHTSGLSASEEERAACESESAVQNERPSRLCAALAATVPHTRSARRTRQLSRGVAAFTGGCPCRLGSLAALRQTHWRTRTLLSVTLHTPPEVQVVTLSCLASVSKAVRLASMPVWRELCVARWPSSNALADLDISQPRAWRAFAFARSTAQSEESLNVMQRAWVGAAQWKDDLRPFFAQRKLLLLLDVFVQQETAI